MLRIVASRSVDSFGMIGLSSGESRTRRLLLMAERVYVGSSAMTQVNFGVLGRQRRLRRYSGRCGSSEPSPSPWAVPVVFSLGLGCTRPNATLRVRAGAIFPTPSSSKPARGDMESCSPAWHGNLGPPRGSCYVREKFRIDHPRDIHRSENSSKSLVSGRIELLATLVKPASYVVDVVLNTSVERRKNP